VPSGVVAHEDAAPRAVTALVGRVREVAALEDLLGSASEHGGSVIVRGEPGIGKSALLDVACRLWAARGGRVLRTDGFPAEMRLPFAALHKLLRPVMGVMRRLTSAQQDALARAFEMLDAPAPEMFRVAQAALDLLAEVAGDQALLLVVEDTQWLDRTSAEVLAFVARRLGADPVCLVASGRLVDDDPLAEACDETLSLGPLEQADAERLLSQNGQFDPRTRRTVLTAAAGNPLALVELPKLVGSVTDSGPPSRWIPMTDRLERAFAFRASQLEGRTGDLLLLAALNDSDRVSELVQATSLLRGEAIGVHDLEPAVDAGLVELKWQSVRFRHPLVRSAVYQAAGLGRRQQAHAVLAQVLDGAPDRRAWHRAEATLGPDDSVADDLEDAAVRALRRGATVDAVASWERAARLSTSESRRASRLLRAAEIATDLGDAELSTRLDEALGGCDLGLRDRLRLEWVREKSEQRMLGGASRVNVLVELAERADADGDSELALGFLVTAGHRCWTSNLGERPSELVALALVRMDHLKRDPRLIVTRAYASPFQGSTEVMAMLNHPGLLSSIDPSGLHLLGQAAACLGAFREAQDLLSAAAEGLREEGRLAALALALRLLAWAALRRGQWDVAGPAAEECGRLAEETRQPMILADALSAQAMLAALRGKMDESEGLAARSERLSPIGAVTLATIQHGRAMRAAGAGEPATAFEQQYRVFLPSDPAYHRMQGAWAIGSLAEYAVMSGHEDAARAEVAKLEPLAALTSAPGVHTGLRYARAQLASDDAAEEHFRGTLDATHGEWPFDNARANLAYGAWLRRNKRITDSRDPLRVARDTFDRLGALGWAERARQELRAAGETSTRRAPEAWDQLSPQEIQIAQMVALGLSNKEIGQRLYLSHRTIASHLYRMFPKLGVTSRAQLTHAVTMRPTAGTPSTRVESLDVV
jgi:DNA-binding CsgD family transcriptional regulator